MKPWKIVDVRAYVVETPGMGGDYLSQGPGHWMVDGRAAGPLSMYPGRESLRSGAGSAVGGVLVEIEEAGGRVGTATGVGGASTCLVIDGALRQGLLGADPRDMSRLWDVMYRTTLTYGRAGIALLALSAVDLALWDLLGQLREEPVYKLAGGATRDRLAAYCTGPHPSVYKELGFWGAKIPLPHGPTDGVVGLRANVEAVRRHREAVGDDFRLMIDCFMSLDVGYAIELAHAVRPYDIFWIEEPLHPDDYEGHRQLRTAAPWVRWATGEHEYTRYGFQRLVHDRAVDLLQPDLMWVGGFSEALRIANLAAAYDMPLVPHAGGVYSYHFAMALPQVPFVEYCIPSAGGTEVSPVFGAMFEGEPLPRDGYVTLSDAPGWGLTLDRTLVSLRRVRSDGSAG